MALIAIDGRKYFDFGIGTYIQQLVKSLSRLKSIHKFVLYASSEDIASVSLPPGWTIAEANYPKYSISEIGLFGLRTKVDKVDVFHEPHYTLPIGIGNISVVTIHDIIHLRFPQLFGRFQRLYSYSMIRHSVRHSRFVIADSEFTKKDILSTFRLNPDKIKVIHLGVSEQYRPLRGHGQLDDFRKRFGIQRPFILYVGNVKPHKGIDILLTAFGQVRKKVDMDLVLVGGSILQDRVLGSLAQGAGIDDRILELGRLNEEDLVMAYNAAEVLVMPSRYEGFGLPALEAMACGTPVLVSNAASLPEIVDDAAIIFKVGNSRELADALLRLLKEPALRREMIKKGREQARKFTWIQTAKQTLDLYEQIIG
jgi:glycosyltransferase involved in cell wall biosynthesis